MVLHTRGRVGHRHFQESLSSEKNTGSLFFAFSPFFFPAIEEEKEIGEDVGAFSPRERNHLLLWEDYNAEEVFEAKEGIAHTGLGVVDAN